MAEKSKKKEIQVEEFMKPPRRLLINEGAGEEEVTDGQIYTLKNIHLNNRILIGGIGRQDEEGAREIRQRNLFTLPNSKGRK